MQVADAIKRSIANDVTGLFICGREVIAAAVKFGSQS